MMCDLYNSTTIAEKEELKEVWRGTARFYEGKIITEGDP